MSLPWSDSPPHRFIEKLMLLKAIAGHDTQEAEREVRMLHERDANGQRHMRFGDSAPRQRADKDVRCRS